MLRDSNPAAPGVSSGPGGAEGQSNTASLTSGRRRKWCQRGYPSCGNGRSTTARVTTSRPCAAEGYAGVCGEGEGTALPAKGRGERIGSLEGREARQLLVEANGGRVEVRREVRVVVCPTRRSLWIEVGKDASFW